MVMRTYNEFKSNIKPSSKQCQTKEDKTCKVTVIAFSDFVFGCAVMFILARKIIFAYSMTVVCVFFVLKHDSVMACVCKAYNR